MAVDTHWETDASLRFTVFRRRSRQGRLTDMPECLGRRPWDLPLLGMDDETADLLRADTPTKTQAVLAGRQAGWLSINDARRVFSLPPIEDGDTVQVTPVGGAPNLQPGGADLHQP